ncbi:MULTISPECIES: hypothetical protein [unclassified Bradyrhizobium]|nr:MULTISPECIES: hypothetical protein [unclassified Bradyrhizobium]
MLVAFDLRHDQSVRYLDAATTSVRPRRLRRASAVRRRRRRGSPGPRG